MAKTGCKRALESRHTQTPLAPEAIVPSVAFPEAKAVAPIAPPRPTEEQRVVGTVGSPAVAPARRNPQSADGVPPATTSFYEPLQAIYSSPGRNFSLDGGHFARWVRGLPATARFGSAAGGLSHDTSPHVLSGGEPVGNGLVGDDALGAAIRPGAGPESDDLDQLVRGLADYASICP